MPSILDHPLISARYFYPRHQPVRDPFMVDCGEVQLACTYHQPHPGAVTVVYFHGNGEVVAESAEQMAEPLADLGVNAFFVEYRGYGGSTGNPALAAMLDDVPKIVRALGVAEKNLVLFGRSVGSIYAIHGTAQFPDIAGLVVESGIADPLGRILLRIEPSDVGVTMEALETEVRARLNHRNILQNFRRPALFLHARCDGMVPVDHAERLHEWAGGPKTLVVFDRGDHNNILTVNFEAYMAALRTFLSSLT